VDDPENATSPQGGTLPLSSYSLSLIPNPPNLKYRQNTLWTWNKLLKRLRLVLTIISVVYLHSIDNPPVKPIHSPGELISSQIISTGEGWRDKGRLRRRVSKKV